MVAWVRREEVRDHRVRLAMEHVEAVETLREGGREEVRGCETKERERACPVK